MPAAHFILFVADQEASTRFYALTLDAAPRLHVPGMSEFELPGGAILGLMPESGIRRLLGEEISDPALATGVPRAELYLVVDVPRAFHRRALDAGARQLSPVVGRDWGHEVGYVADPDGHILAFARNLADDPTRAGEEEESTP